MSFQNRDDFFGGAVGGGDAVAAVGASCFGGGANGRGCASCEASFGGGVALRAAAPAFSPTEVAIAGATNCGCWITPLAAGNRVVG
jgi:hypothetical protein